MEVSLSELKKELDTINTENHKLKSFSSVQIKNLMHEINGMQELLHREIHEKNILQKRFKALENEKTSIEDKLTKEIYLKNFIEETIRRTREENFKLDILNNSLSQELQKYKTESSSNSRVLFQSKNSDSIN